MLYNIFVKNFFGEHTFPHIQERKKRRKGKGGKSSSTEEEGGSRKAKHERRRGFFLPSSPSFPIFWMREISSAAKQPTVFLPFFSVSLLGWSHAHHSHHTWITAAEEGGEKKRLPYVLFPNNFSKKGKGKRFLRQNQFYALLTRQAAALPFTTQQTINPRGLTKKGENGGGEETLRGFPISEPAFVHRAEKGKREGRRLISEFYLRERNRRGTAFLGCRPRTGTHSLTKATQARTVISFPPEFKSVSLSLFLCRSESWGNPWWPRSPPPSIPTLLSSGEGG